MLARKKNMWGIADRRSNVYEVDFYIKQKNGVFKIF